MESIIRNSMALAILLGSLVCIDSGIAAESAVVESEFIYTTAPFPECHASTIVQAADGTLVAAWFGGTREKNPDVGIWVARKLKGNWTAPAEVATGVQSADERFPCWNPVLFQPQDGPLVLFFKVGPNPSQWWGELLISTDHGKTWQDRRRLPNKGIGPVKNKPVQMADGSIWCPSSTEHDGWRVHLEVTRDKLKTWTTTGSLNPKERGAIQPSLLTYRDGRWQMLCRNQNGNDGSLWQTWSEDQGKTWGEFEPTGLPNPNSGTDAVTLSDGRQLLVYNHTNRGGSFPANREMLNVAVSEDGRAWSAALVLERSKGEYSYPAVIQTDDGLVHITYTWRRQRVRHVVVDPNKLTLKPIEASAWPEGVEQLAAAEASASEKTAVRNDDAATAPLQRLAFNRPDATNYLGVGLWAWPLPIDWDNDGDLDLVVSCPDVPYRGIHLFENPGGGKFPVFKPAVLVGDRQANISISYVDGEPRVLVPGHELKNFRETRFAEQAKIQEQTNIHPNKVRQNLWRYVDYDGDGALDVIVGVGDWTDYGWDNAYDSEGNWTNGPLHGYVYVLRNRGTSEQPNYEEPVKVLADGKPVDVYGMPSPNFADFDGDGDLDLLCGEFVDSFSYFENVGSRTNPRYASARKLEYDGHPIKMDLQMIVPTAIDWDGDGDVDLIVGDEDGRVALVEHTGRIVDGVPVFLPPKYFRQEAQHVKFGALVTPVSVDWDDDGDEDLICGNSAGYIALIENLDGGNPPKWSEPQLLAADGETIRVQAGSNGSIQGPCEAKWGYTTLSVADWDHDGLRDLIVNSIWGKVVWYRNVGSAGSPKLAAARPIEVDWLEGSQPPSPAWNWWKPNGNELSTQWRTTPVVIDLDLDGLNDLVMLDHEGYLSFFRRSRDGDTLRLAPGQRIFHDSTGQPLRLNAGEAGRSGRRKLCFADWDRDGRLDLLVNSTSINLLRNVSTKDRPWTFHDEGPIDETRLAGHTTSPTIVDWDRDGRPDLVIGAEDGHLYYRPNNWKLQY
ncbi:MAG TPA: exo-alpha-sialidase [Pirellulaceae bacterium]|nr:exo-alpha-sialidase [Pirellulaceae bacterium]